MPIRATSLYNSTATDISNAINGQYDVVKLVSENLDGISAVAAAILAGFDPQDLADVSNTLTQINVELDTKVDKITGKGLSTNDYTDLEKAKLAGIAVGATVNQTDSYLLNRAYHTGTQSLDTTSDSTTRLAMTPTERAKLSGIAVGANAYVHPSLHPVTILDAAGNQNKFVKTDALGAVGWDYVSWSDIQGKPSAYTPAAHEHDMSEISTGSLSAARVTQTTDRNFVTADDLANLAKVVTTDSSGVPNGYAPLDANGKINTSYINDLSTVEVFTPADEASMLLLTSANLGDIAYRQDTEQTYMLVALPSSTLENWKPLNIGAYVLSVNGLTGIVAINTGDIPEGANLYFTDERADARVIALAYTKTEVQTSLPIIGLDIAAGEVVGEGQLAWNADERTVDLGLGSNVVLQVGQEQLIGVRNGSGATIDELTVCMYNGTIGNSGKLTVIPCDASNSDMIVGIATEPIAAGADGFITTFGKIRGVDTRTWAEGTILYVASDGGLTDAVPMTGLRMPIAVVISSSIAGTIFVRVNGLDENAYEPADVAIQTIVQRYGRADKYLAAQDIAAMLYLSGDLVKIQYNDATDNDYEVLNYTSGNLASIEHYVEATLQGTTNLVYTDGNLTSSIFTEA